MSIVQRLKYIIFSWSRSCIQRRIQGGGGEVGGPHPPFFSQSLVFFGITLKNYKLLFEVELIFNNKPLTYVYPNTIETSFTPNHLLFSRQLLYSSNTTSNLVRNLTVLSGTTDKINCISNHFWDRWRLGYVVNLGETQQTSKLNINSLKINVNHIVLVFYEKVPKHFWRTLIVTRLLSSRDSEMRGAIVRIAKANTIFKHPVKKNSSQLIIHIMSLTKQIRQRNKSLDIEHWTSLMLPNVVSK